MDKYRNLSTVEIIVLEENRCVCDDWSKILVKKKFLPYNIQNVNFSGDIKLGIFEKIITFHGNIKRDSGIYNATIHNCEIGDNVYINDIRNYIANYNIQNNVCIECVDTLSVDGNSSFGNGIKVAVLNETGGREVPIYNELSAHTAYLTAFYRHKPKLIAKLQNLIDDYSKKISSQMGTIGKGAQIRSCRTILNVNIGEYAVLDGVNRLCNGTINSSQQDPAIIGPDVIAKNFITTSGSNINQASVINNCFVGQGTVLDKQYSAENSVFFANCQGLHGEACSIFAGPYTVSHHKSTLLIAAYYSFLNAGSGSNQSNHKYKLGPIHQGIVERGSKTTSDSYILWPGKIGAFSLIMGRHYRNLDTSDLPFSYLIENKDESILVPAINLKSIGTIRDARKWPKRDIRKDNNLLDAILFNLLSPYSIQKMIKGYKILENLRETSGSLSEYYMFNSAIISHRALERGIYLYKLGIIKFLGNGLVKKLEISEYSNEDEMHKALSPHSNEGVCEWIDMGGLLVPKEIVNKLIDRIENDEIKLEELNNHYHEWKKMYPIWAWNWIVKRLKSEVDIDIKTVSVERLIEFVNQWKEAVVSLDEMMYEDAKKEFTLQSQTGFGIDGEEEIRISDFENVRGEFKKHPAVKDIIVHIDKKTKLAEKVINKLKKVC
ncbi:MAG: DUF4954 family protein [Marinilabiliaceae bacterium]|nr:DUF4954 family protein [Marinilabiliaceae bacterium]